MMDYENWNFAPQGWECPKCKRVYSPMTPMCWYCGNKDTVATTHMQEIGIEDVDEYILKQKRTVPKEDSSTC